MNNLISQLTLGQKVQLLTGEDFWTLHAAPKIGLRKLVLSDGPSGVRGELWDERSDSLSLPSATGVAATWNIETLHRMGEVMASEARRKNVDVVLGPTINLHRSPLGGRHFEAYSEDSVLSGKLAAAFIRGLQGQGVAGCLKHFVANDAETDRHTVDNIVDEKTLREVYALAFEIAVRDSHPWTIMSAYNRVNGPKMAASPLLNSVVKDEWNWDGAVISDWTGVVSTEDTGREGNDIEMPGPFGFWGEKLIEAVRSGAVPEEAIDAKLTRLLLLAQRVGKLGSATEKQHRKFAKSELLEAARDIGAESIVLAKNNDKVLPLEAVKKVAVLGAHARFSRGQGGGSATVYPTHLVSGVEGLINGAPEGVDVKYSQGVNSDDSLIPLTGEYVTHPDSGIPGSKIEIFSKDGTRIFTEDRAGAFFSWMTPPWIFDYAYIKVSAVFTAQSSGVHEFGIGMVGDYTVRIGEEEHKGNSPINSDDLGEYVLNPPTTSFSRNLAAGEKVHLEWEYPQGSLPIPVAAFLIGFKEPVRSKEVEFAEAAALAQNSDVTLVFVGTTSAIESEGHDRANLKLPQGQDEFVSEIAKVAKKTIVIVNAGSPVEMPWFDQVDAVLLTWFGGQELGNALADVIYGVVNPSGHLPTTWAREIGDVPVLNTKPTNGELVYAEGPFIGYRAWVKSGVTPLLPFGFGLSYTDFESSLLEATRESVRVRVTNVGSRSGSYVAQIYIRNSNVPSYEKRLSGFAKVLLAPGESKEVDVNLEPLTFKFFKGEWLDANGPWEITLANHVLEVGETCII